MNSLSILTLHGFLLFVGAELIFSLTPGPTVMLISAYGFKGGFRDALAAICRHPDRQHLWYVICVTGLGALVTASPLVFHAIKIAGAAYLVWLGASALWQSWHATAEAQGPKLMGKPYVQATLTQLGNPKAILFFGALVPQFLDTTCTAPAAICDHVRRHLHRRKHHPNRLWRAGGYRAAAAAELRHAVWRERISGTGAAVLGVLAALSPRMTPEDFITRQCRPDGAAAGAGDQALSRHRSGAAVARDRRGTGPGSACRRPIGPLPGRAARRWRAMCWIIPTWCAGKRVLDIGAGSGLVATGGGEGRRGQRAGRRHRCLFRRRHPPQCRGQWRDDRGDADDLIGSAGAWDVILVGDLFYERPLAERLLAWLKPLDAPALLGDPGRNYFPKTRRRKTGRL